MSRNKPSFSKGWFFHAHFTERRVSTADKQTQAERNDAIFDAVLRELSLRREEIIGGRLERLGGVDIHIRMAPGEDPGIEITRHICACP